MEQHDSHVKLYYHLWQHTSRKADDRAGQHDRFEVFWADAATVKLWADEARNATCFHEATAIEEAGTGWFWWSCMPGCLPDGEACGPFNTSQEAYNDAQDDDVDTEAATDEFERLNGRR